MSMDTDLIISGRKRDLGGFSVVRSIPSAVRRHVGPFVFLDHMGPMRIDDTHALDVRPHPHIGLATVTYLFEGRGHHRDSLGSSQVIKPGDLNWMTAGRGIVHSERTPKEDRNPADRNRIHGVQIWVGLPVEHEETAPSFVNYQKEVIPSIQISPMLSGKLLVGSSHGVTSPVKSLSPAIFLDLISEKSGTEIISFNEKEIGIFLITGSCEINNQSIDPDDLIVVSDPKNILINFSAGARIIIIGGEPFPEPRYIWWNFISSSKERIRKAAEEWSNQKMGKVAEEDDFIPLPDLPFP